MAGSTRPWRCKQCGSYQDRFQEKQTDVALAVEMMHDAFSGNCDTIWLMSADADLVPAVRYISHHFPDLTVVVLRPRGRRATSSSPPLIPSAISATLAGPAQLPDLMVFTGNEMLRRPTEWT